MTMPMHTPPTLEAPPTPPSNGLAVTALVLGCCSVFFFWLYAIVPILAIVFGAVSMDRSKKAGRKPSGMAVAGLTLGVIFAAIFALILLAAVSQ
jgi:hypothetical protein